MKVEFRGKNPVATENDIQYYDNDDNGLYEILDGCEKGSIAMLIGYDSASRKLVLLSDVSVCWSGNAARRIRKLLPTETVTLAND